MTETTPNTNAFGQPVGPELPGWTALPPLSDAPLIGRWCRLERTDPGRDAGDLHAAFIEDDGRMWTYVPWGPFASSEDLASLLESRTDFQWFTIIRADTGARVGLAAYMRHEPANGSVEVGGVTFSPQLQRTRAATEAMALMMRRAFEHGYRRYEWKCDALNGPSRAAALRLGFRFEGIFRQERVYRGRNRDTAWFSVTDAEWPALAKAFEAWLAPENFDAQGRQRLALAQMSREMAA